MVHREGNRVLIYSHDSYGLGHLRRCRAIAHSLVRHNPEVSVLILSGSPFIGNFPFRTRVDFVRLPGVIKQRNGDYSSHSLHLRIEETVALRAAIIRHTADGFDPDLFIVDKEPHGLRGEVSDTLDLLKARGTSLVLGLRDIMDEPDLLSREWERKQAMPVLRDVYDQIWVYGLPQICDPLEGLEVPASVRRKMIYTGYLRRRVPEETTSVSPFDGGPYVLVTVGGGADGTEVIDWILDAYETDKELPIPAFIVFGPFLAPEQQAAFNERIERLDNVEAITFDRTPELLMAKAASVVAMGGYNTFCEILSFNKKAVVVPRTEPRLEQFIRASRAQELGLLRMLIDDGKRNPRVMATALRHLQQQNPPSDVILPGLLHGLDNVNRLADHIFARERAVAGLRVAGGSPG
ncbi:MAG: glycosyltransferase family protein [Alphaproteobacteria bacterium]